MDVTTTKRIPETVIRLGTALRWSLLVSLTVVVGFLLARVLNGHLHAAPTELTLVFCALLVAISLFAVRLPVLLEATSGPTQWLGICTGMVLHLLVLTTWISMARTSWVISFCLCVAVLSEAVCLLLVFRKTRGAIRAPIGSRQAVDSGVVQEAILPASNAPLVEEDNVSRLKSSELADGPFSESAEAGESAETGDPDCFEEDIRRQVTLTRDAEGYETISGVVREDFESEQRSIVSHVMFQPPLLQSPHVEAHVIEGPSATIKATRVEKFGVRFEIRLEKPSDRDATVAYEFIGRHPKHEEEDN